MKSKIQILFAMAFILLSSLAYAQVPQLFNYQGIARDAKGNPLSKQQMSLKISVLPAADATAAEYEETQIVSTNEFGLYTLQIGNGTQVSGTMKAVKWETGNKYIKVAIDPTGGSNYIDAGTSQLLTVPYAIYADKAGTAADHDKTRTGAVNSNAAHVAGDANYLTKFTALNTIGKSLIFENSGTGNIGIGTTVPGAKFQITNTVAAVQEHFRMQNLSTTGAGRFTMYNDGVPSYATFTKYGSAFAGGYAGIAAMYPYANLLAFGNNGLAANDGNGRFLISTAGNAGISILKSGTSKLKFHADFATENVGIGGNATPAARVHLNNSDGTSMNVRLTNNTTGHTSNDGLEIGNTGNAAYIINNENANIVMGITSTPDIMTLTTAGNAEFSGQIKIAGGAPGAGKILSSDAAGLGSWNTPTALGLVSGSGTTNVIPKFTPNGTTLGNSMISDNGNEINVGVTASSGSTLNVGASVNSDTSSLSFRTSGQLGTIFVNNLGQLQFTPNNSDPSGGSPTLTLDDDGGGATFEDNVKVNGRIGVGTASPVAKIHAIAGVDIDTAIFATTTSGNNRQVGVFGTYNTAGYGAGIVGRGIGGTVPPALNDIGVYGSSSGTAVWSAGTLRVSGSSEGTGKTLTCLNASGDAVWSSAVGFRATSYNSAIGVGSSVTMIYPTQTFDDGLGYNNVTGGFTAPESGIYTFSYSSTHQAIAGYTTGNVFSNFEVNGSLLTGSSANFEPSKTSFWSIQNTTTIKLVAGDIVTVRYDNNTNVSLVANANNTFNGYRVR